MDTERSLSGGWRWTRAAVVVGLLGLLCGSLLSCGGGRATPEVAGQAPPVLVCPAHGGAPWVELKSKHFVLKTDLPVEHSKIILGAMEVLRSALVAAMMAETDRPMPPVEVVLFERHADFQAINSVPNLGGYATRQLPGDVEPSPIIVAFGKLSYGTRSTLVHELVHQILLQRTANLPWWLDEGLAVYFSTLWIKNAEDGVAVVGDPPLDVDFGAIESPVLEANGRTWKHVIPRKEAPTFEALLVTSPRTVPASKLPTHYAAAGKLMQVLAGHRNPNYSPRFWNMLARLSDGAPGQEAFTLAYSGVPMSEIAAAYDARLLDHTESPFPLDFLPPNNLTIEERPMRDGEIHALWARLLAARPTSQRSAGTELFSGEHDDPHSLSFRYARASILLQTGESTSVEDDVRALLTSAPEDPAYLLLALLEARRAHRTEKDPDLKAAHLQKLQQLADKLSQKARTGAQQSLTAATLGELSQMPRALQLAEKSTLTDPTCASCFDIRAHLALAAGDLDTAEQAALRALRLTDESTSFATFAALLDRITAERRKRPSRPAAPDAAAPGGSTRDPVSP